MIGRLFALALVALICVALVVTWSDSADGGPAQIVPRSERPPQVTEGLRTFGYGQVAYRRIGAERWALRLRREQRDFRTVYGDWTRERRRAARLALELGAKERALAALRREIRTLEERRVLAATSDDAAADGGRGPDGNAGPSLRSSSVPDVICSVFGSYCEQALSVARCESAFNPAAINGQYLGTFQMGEAERAQYGHGYDAETQARAAYAYFIASGADWSPWECRP